MQPITKTIPHPVFGQINLIDGRTIAECWLSLDGREVEILIWADARTTTPAQIDRVGLLMQRLPALNAEIIAEFQRRFATRPQRNVVSDYLDHHCDLNVVTEANLRTVLPQGPLTAENLFGKLQLLRGSVYPDPDEELLSCFRDEGHPENEVAANLDFGLGLDFTQYVLAVKLNFSGQVLSIEIES